MVRLQQAIRGLRYSKTTSNDWQKPFAGTTSRYTENRFHEAKSMGCRQMRKIQVGEVRDDGVLHWIWIMFVMGCDYRSGWWFRRVCVP